MSTVHYMLHPANEHSRSTVEPVGGDVTSAASLAVFTQRRKTCLFRQSYPDLQYSFDIFTDVIVELILVI